jgi:hypothetical protein
LRRRVDALPRAPFSHHRIEHALRRDPPEIRCRERHGIDETRKLHLGPRQAAVVGLPQHVAGREPPVPGVDDIEERGRLRQIMRQHT